MGSGRKGRRRKGKTHDEDSPLPPPAEGNEAAKKTEHPSTPKDKGKGTEPDDEKPPKVTTLMTPDRVPKSIDIHDMSPIALPTARARLSQDARRALSAEAERHSAAKRRWSNMSKSSQSLHEAAKRSKKFGDESSKEFKHFVRDIHEDFVEATIKLHRERLGSMQAAMKILVNDYKEGKSALRADEYQAVLQAQETAIGDQLNKVVSLVDSQFRITAQMRQDVALQQFVQDVEPFDWAYIDLVLTRFQVPTGAKVVFKNPRDDDNHQTTFRNEVLKLYNSSAPPAEDGTPQFFCVISGKPVTNMCAAHIVKHNVTEVVAERLFGKAGHQRGHLYNPANGIPIAKGFERMLDKSEIVIIPGDKPGSWKVHCLGKKKDFHGRHLTFRSDFRPAARFLYFRFLASILLRQRHEVDTWWQDRMEFGGGEMWASPGDYLRTSLMNNLARTIGQVPQGEADKIFPLDPSASPDDKELDQHLSAVAARNLLAPMTKERVVPGTPRVDDEGDDEPMDETPSRSTDYFGAMDVEK